MNCAAGDGSAAASFKLSPFEVEFLRVLGEAGVSHEVPVELLFVRAAWHAFVPAVDGSPLDDGGEWGWFARSFPRELWDDRDLDVLGAVGHHLSLLAMQVARCDAAIVAYIALAKAASLRGPIDERAWRDVQGTISRAWITDPAFARSALEIAHLPSVREVTPAHLGALEAHMRSREGADYCEYFVAAWLFECYSRVIERGESKRGESKTTPARARKSTGGLERLSEEDRALFEKLPVREPLKGSKELADLWKMGQDAARARYSALANRANTLAGRPVLMHVKRGHEKGQFGRLE
jgi:hypothetical protein